MGFGGTLLGVVGFVGIVMWLIDEQEKTGKCTNSILWGIGWLAFLAFLDIKFFS